MRSLINCQIEQIENYAKNIENFMKVKNQMEILNITKLIKFNDFICFSF